MTEIALTRPALIGRKLRGCLSTFGVRETARRCWREAVRVLAPRDRDQLDVHEVHPLLLVGAIPRSGVAIDRLVTRGVTDVLDLRAERSPEDLLPRVTTLRVHWVPTYDDWRPKAPAFYTKVAETAREVWLRRPEARLLVGCAAGEHRGPLGAAVVLGALLGDLDDALRRIRAARAQAEFLPVYERSLREYWAARRTA